MQRKSRQADEAHRGDVINKPWQNRLVSHEPFRRRSCRSRSSFTMRPGSETERSLAATAPRISSCASTRIPRCVFPQPQLLSDHICFSRPFDAVRLPVYGGGQGDGADKKDLRLRVPTSATAGVEQPRQREGDRGQLGQRFPNQGEKSVA